MEITLKKAKKIIKDKFPQLGQNFIVWKPSGTIGNVFKVQQYVGNKELFGHEYYVDLDLMDICL